MDNSLKEYKEDLTWEDKARVNPLYAIMSDDIYLSSDVEPTDEQLLTFYRQGSRFWGRWFRPLFWDKDNLRNIKVLEYGCGMGRIINSAAADGFDCFGVDISKSQIAYATKFCPSASNISFAVLSKANEIPHPDGCFDFVYSYAVLQHIKEKSGVIKAIKEMARVVKPDGKLKIQLRTIHSLFKSGKQVAYHGWVFQNFTIAFYLRKLSFLYIPRIKRIKHSNWSGAGCLFACSDVTAILAKNNIRTDSLEFDVLNDVLWIVGTKK